MFLLSKTTLLMTDFKNLLITDYPVSVHQGYLWLLLAEIYQTKMNFNPYFMKENFAKREIYYSLWEIQEINYIKYINSIIHY